MTRRYRLADWTPDAGDEDEWLARWADAGWNPGFPDGAWTTVGGRQIKRHALVQEEPDGAQSAIRAVGATPRARGCLTSSWNMSSGPAGEPPLTAAGQSL